MAEYIDREALLRELRFGAYAKYPSGAYDAITSIVRDIEKLPAADVRTVVRGRWMYDCERTMGDGWTYRQYHCTECGRQEIGGLQNFCPNCGADMREG